jgi:hypothetical protein
MTIPTSAAKRLRATLLSLAAPPRPTPGILDVLWESPFDRLCYDVSDPQLPTADPPRYTTLLGELTRDTGCTEDELLAHGAKVRGILFFAEDHLTRRGALASLMGSQQHRYRLHPVVPEF